MAKKKQKSKIADAKLNALTQRKTASQNQIDRLQSQITSLQKQYTQEKKNKNAASEIENSYKKNRMTHLLSLNKTFAELKKTIKLTSNTAFENKLSNLRITLSKTREKLLQTYKAITNRQEELKKQEASNKTKRSLTSGNKKEVTYNANLKRANQEIPLKPKFSPLYSPTFNTGTITFEAEWDNVGFADGFITIKHNGHWYRKDIVQSKKYLDEIKRFYKFHNIPKLKVILRDSIIYTIENQEVLFYHIDFLGIAAPNFGFIKLSPFRQKYWKKYTKQYYKVNLPFVFHTHTLKRLCEYCDPDLPIIPVGEAIINSSGLKVVHNSFLFPMKSKTGYSIVWESIEEAKASYIFSLNTFADKDIQTLFDYIAGDTPNKRWTLINSKSLQDRLKMKNRIFHTDLSLWDYEIRLLS
jgi:hypothetical protein